MNNPPRRQIIPKPWSKIETKTHLDPRRARKKKTDKEQGPGSGVGRKKVLYQGSPLPLTSSAPYVYTGPGRRPKHRYRRGTKCFGSFQSWALLVERGGGKWPIPESSGLPLCLWREYRPGSLVLVAPRLPDCIPGVLVERIRWWGSREHTSAVRGRIISSKSFA